MHVYRLNISVMTSEIDPEIFIIKTHECKYASHTSQEHLRYSIRAHLSFPFLPRAEDFNVLSAGSVDHFQCSVVQGPDAAEGPTGAAGLVFHRQIAADAVQNGTA